MKTKLSLANRVFFPVFLAGTAWSAWNHQWAVAAALLCGLGYTAWAIRGAARGTVGELTRLDAGQPVDERDRLLQDRALSIVGVFAIAMAAAEFFYRIGGPEAGRNMGEAAFRLAFLSLVWLVANRVVLRQGADRG